jgi:hypothetical protein
VYSPYKIWQIKETWAAEIKLRAWRRLGEISRGLAKRQNQHDALPIIGRAKNEVLAQAGVSVQDASRRECCDKCPFDVTKDYESGKDIFFETGRGKDREDYFLGGELAGIGLLRLGSEIVT